MLNQTQEQLQKQGLTTRQIQQIHLIELPALDLGQRIRKEIEENPALDASLPLDRKSAEIQEPGGEEFRSDSEEETEREPSGEEKFDDSSMYDYREEDDIPYYKLREIADRERKAQEIPFASSSLSLSEYVENQIEMLPWSHEEKQIAQYIVGNLREDGYLDRSSFDISGDLLFKESLDIPMQKVEQVIEKIQQLDPPGVAARSLQECLILQLQRLPSEEKGRKTELILSKYYDHLVARRYERIISKRISEEELHEAIEVISHLNPKPGNGFDSSNTSMFMVVNPDFIIHEDENGNLTLTLTDDRELPSLRISPTFEQMLQKFQESKENGVKPDKSQRETIRFAREKVGQAEWFIFALRQRFETLRSTMTVIMNLQADFFRSGILSDLKPMILRDVAEITGYDISTISRVSNSKYVQCDYGIYPVKFFFSDATITEDGTEISSREVKRLLAEIIENEDKKHPLTDQALMDQLKSQGFPIARRTVAKYREQLGFPTAKMRRTL